MIQKHASLYAKSGGIDENQNYQSSLDLNTKEKLLFTANNNSGRLTIEPMFTHPSIPDSVPRKIFKLAVSALPLFCTGSCALPS